MDRRLSRLSRLPGLFKSPFQGRLRHLSSSVWEHDIDLQHKIEAQKAKKHTLAMTLALGFGSLGVIYGDIGTSPLYVFASTFTTIVPNEQDLLGAMSIIFWLLTLIILIKYVFIVMRADNQGEGGTFSLYSLLCHHLRINPHGKQELAESRSLKVNRSSGSRKVANKLLRFGALDGSMLRAKIRSSTSMQLILLVSVCFGVGLVLADGVLTPAQSVLSAVSGLGVAPAISGKLTQGAIIGITLALLVGLFAIQSFGTRRISFLFSPIVLLWLLSNAAIGVYNMSKHGAGVWRALSPGYAFDFLVRNKKLGWEMLGGLFLSITGGEAMFADLGHFSVGGITLAFSGIVFPSLLLTYLGQTSFLIRNPTDVGDTYWKAIPKPIFWPMLVLATLASLVASQALITASFSIFRQSMNLGLFPKMRVHNTGKDVEGQIYIAPVNWLLMILCIVAVAVFKDTTHLGNAYGVAVNFDMLNTTLLIGLVMLVVWEISLILVVFYLCVFVALEGTLLTSNLNKVPHGGYFTLTIAFCVAAIKLLWWAGTKRQRKALKDLTVPPSTLFRAMAAAPDSPSTEQNPLLDPLRSLCLVSDPDRPLASIPGLGVYYTDSASSAPASMVHFLKTASAVHDVVILITVRFLPLPYLESSERFLIQPLPGVGNFHQVVVRYGYAEEVVHDVAFVNLLVSRIEDFLLQSDVFAAPFPMEATDEGGSDNEEGPASPGQTLKSDMASDATGSKAQLGRKLSFKKEPPRRQSTFQKLPAMAELQEVSVRGEDSESKPIEPGSEAEITGADPALGTDPLEPSAAQVAQAPTDTAALAIVTSGESDDGAPVPPMRSTYARTGLWATELPAAQQKDLGGVPYSRVTSLMAPYRTLAVRTLKRAAAERVVFYTGNYIVHCKARGPNQSRARAWTREIMYGTIYPALRILDQNAREVYKIPGERLMEVGMVIEL